MTDSASVSFAERCVHELIAERAVEQPASPALIWGERAISYNEVERRANQLAHRLRTLGVGPETLVGICLRRSPDVVVAALAVLKAGGAYLPLDPTYPAERLRLILADTQVRVLISDSTLLERLPAHSAHPLLLDAEDATLAAEPATPPITGVQPHHLAYVIYTSGSTGQPKGVQISHRSLLGFLLAFAQRVAISASDILLGRTSLSFDPSTVEVFLPLLLGARVLVLDDATASDGALLGRAIDSVTVAQLTPSHCRLLLDAGWQGNSHLKLLCGAEALSRPLANQLLERCGELWNIYGPTETTVWATAGRVTRESDPVSVGRPLDNVQIYLLDAQLQPVAAGVSGEIYIGGNGLARGYLNRPELTAERFVDYRLPTGNNAEQSAANLKLKTEHLKLYKTGDVARLLPNGELEFIGRSDFQVKIRGYRIEPGEIEAILLQHMAVRQAVVVGQPDPAGGQRLVAYVVTSDEIPVTSAGAVSLVTYHLSLVTDLRSWLQARLPSYMLPTAIVPLAALPLTPTGKLNRLALPAASFAHSASAEHTPPASEREHALAAIWADVLGIGNIGRNDDFVALGGHSLAASLVAARARSELGLPLAAVDLLGGASLAQLAARIGEAGASLQAEPPILPVDRSGPLPLSYAQRRLWFLHQLEPESAAYNEPIALRLQGSLDPQALEQAINALLTRHAVLRTSFGNTAGQPTQQVLAEAPLALTLVDLPPHSDAAALLAAEARVPFDLSQAPLLRATLLRIAPHEHLLLLVLHHIVTDGWSEPLLLHDLAACYSAFAAGASCNLPALPLQYADYAVWQRSQLAAHTPEAGQLDYWRQQLAGDLPLLELPIAHSPVAAPSSAGDIVRFTVPGELVAALEALARTSGCTPFMLLLTAFQMLLARYTGSSDIVVGTPVAGRERPELASLLGFFVNSLSLRSDLAGNPSFRVALARVRAVCLAAYANQELPFDLLVEQLHPTRDLRHHPFFQTMFVLQDAPAPLAAWPGLNVQPLMVHNGAAKFDLTLELLPQGATLAGSFEYRCDLFERAAIERLAGHFLTLLAAAVAQPDTPLSDLPLLTNTEQQRLAEWGNPASNYPHEATIAQLFEQQAAQQPNTTALLFGEQRLSYAELNSRANQFAHRLRRLGVCPGTLVGIAAERSIELVVGLLAILKAGGAYVPLDPAYPAERLALMLHDTKVPLLLIQRPLVARLPVRMLTLVALDDPRQVEQEPTANLQHATGPLDPAYVIYTSGSTGQPKGVLVPQRAVIRLVRNTNYADFSPEDTFLQLAPISFDASTLELWGSLLNGATLAILPPGAPTLAELAAALQHYRVTVLWLTAGLFHLMVEQQLAALGGLRLLLAGGDVLSPAHVQRVLLAGGPTLINGYGPTENTTFTCCYPMTSPEQVGVNVPIGWPIANTSVYILDAQQKPVPVGVPGELYTGGDGLALGYLNQPDLTAERFVDVDLSASTEIGKQGDLEGAANLKQSTQHLKLYRTGDLARYLPDGSIEFLGRVDSQVKIRGYRIEPGEIEAALLTHPAVRAAVVVARESGRTAGDKQLVAYVVLDHRPQTADQNWRDADYNKHADEQRPLLSSVGQSSFVLRPSSFVTDLRDHLRASLPEYMLPATIMQLDTLPLGPNGKLNRRSLPSPPLVDLARSSAYLAPRTPHEQLLATIWGELLGLPAVGVHDNFFELGGDSILSIQAVARAAEAGLQLTPRQLFQHQTIAALAAIADQSPAPAFVQQEDVPGLLPLTPIQHWFFGYNHAAPQHFNQAMLLELRQPLAPQLLQQAVVLLLEQHAALRLRFNQQAGVWQQAVAPAGEELPFATHNLAALTSHEQHHAIEQEAARAQASLQLEHGPLLRVLHFDCGPNTPARLLIIVHHLVVDGVSWRILLADLATLCARLAPQLASTELLPAPTSSFAQWATRVAHYAYTAELQAEAPYWLQPLPTGVEQLPYDFAGDTAQKEESSQVVVASLDATTTRLLLQEVPAIYRVRITELLLAALARALRPWTQRNQLLIDLESHGREELWPDINLARTVGWFTSIYPVLLELPAGDDSEQAIVAVKERLRSVPNNGIGYGLLRYGSAENMREQLAALPRPQLAFNYLGQFDQVLAGEAPWQPAPEAVGPLSAPGNLRPHPLVIDCSVVGGQLRAEWSYSVALHHQATIAQLAARFLSELQQLVVHCCQTPGGGIAPSDFPLARLDAMRLQQLTSTDRLVEDIYPLAPGQQMLLEGTLGAPRGVYVVQWSYSIQGPLRAEALRRAWQCVLDAHPILRSAFAWQGLNEPLQLVRRRVELPWAEHDWRALPPDEQHAQLEMLLRADRERAFDLAHAPLLRVTLVRTGEQTHQLLWSHHHLLLDGWSVPHLWRDLFGYYEAVCQGRDLRTSERPHGGLERRQRPTAPLGQAYLPPHARPYRDHIAWLQQPRPADELFWRNLLHGSAIINSGQHSVFGIQRSAFGVPHSAFSVQPADYLERRTTLSLATTAALQALAQRQHFTMSVLLQAAWALVLSARSGQPNVLFGVTLAGRPAALSGVEAMVGLFINTLPLPLQVAPEAALQPWLASIHERVADMRQHEHASLAELRAWADLAPDAPLFSSFVRYQNYPGDPGLAHPAPGLALHNSRIIDWWHLPIAVVGEPGPALALELVADRRILGDVEVEQLLGLLCVALEALAAGSAHTVGAIVAGLRAWEIDR